VLVLTPTSKDAALTQAILSRAGVLSTCFADLPQLCAGLTEGASTLLISEESVAPGQYDCLTEWLARQPPWSDMPILVLARPGADSAGVARAMDVLGNVTVLERPLRVAALVSAVRSAVRARQRQYQIREYISEKERTGRQLREAVDEMQTLLNTLPVGVVISHDARGTRITGNRVAEDMLRTAQGDNLSKSSTNPKPPRHFQLRRNGAEILPHDYPTQRAIRGESVRGEEIECVFDDDSVMTLVVSATPLIGADGSPRAAVAGMVDISRQKAAESALRDADRRKDDFLAMLAHELRNPLAPIRNALHILRLTSEQDAPSERLADMLERQVSHMVRLVDDLLEVSRITHGKIELRRECVAVETVIASAVEASRPLIESSGHLLSVDVANETMVLDADPVRIAQVISNLLNNAAKYTDTGGNIALTARRDGDGVVIAVRDSGMGIPHDMLPRVFDLFTQVHNSADRAQGGLGIGLTLVRTLVELHGGTVTAHSAGRSRGSEFVVRLPAGKDTGERAAFGRRADRNGAVSARRVLVVDDNRDAADSLGAVLTLLGADVFVAHDGPSALDAVTRYRPTVVLLDIGMDGMDGYEVARQVRDNPGNASIVLIALTGWGQDEDRRRTAAAGFDYHLVKPADIGALQSILTTLERRNIVPVGAAAS
jgi:signal transduction histidine kinase/ActR/RegA family two-component response regulator